MKNQKLFSKNRRYIISLTNLLANSGEGSVWETNMGFLAKIYHTPDKQKEEKLKFMINCQPDNPTSRHNHNALAWPLDILEDSSGKFCGFLMNKIAGYQLPLAYMPKSRNQSIPGFNWEYLHKTASNLASSVHAIHSKGYVIGDLKPENILFDNRALVSIIDVDSFQVSDRSKIYRCEVGSIEFRAPELIGIKDLSQVDRNIHHDLFALAVIFYQLLFTAHPYSGKWTSSKPEIQDLDERIKQGYWLYSPFSPIGKAPHSIPIEIAHPGLVSLFKRCFNDGYRNPKNRPTSMEWKKAFDIALQNLDSCKISTHKYSKTYGKCYWCETTKKYNRDIYFPHQPVTQTSNKARTQSSPPPQATATKHSPPINHSPIPVINNSSSISLKTLLYSILGIALLGTTVNVIQSFRSFTPPNIPVPFKPTEYPNPQKIPKQKKSQPKSQKSNNKPSPKKSLNEIPKSDQLSGNKAIQKNLEKPSTAGNSSAKQSKISKSAVNTNSPTIGEKQHKTSNSKSIKNKMPDKLLKVKANLSATNFSFPMNKCGEQGNPESGKWYRVLINSHNLTLDQIKFKYCSDAFLKKDENTRDKYIQVASFRDKKKAEDLANILKRELKNTDIKISLN
jgi:DNA-binding helix-hairpin-helix protein with protein kinase domain